MVVASIGERPFHLLRVILDLAAPCERCRDGAPACVRPVKEVCSDQAGRSRLRVDAPG
jgi:hypothetical protein